MPIRLLISDIDGTLVRDDKSLSDAVVDAIKRLRSHGIEVSLISARPPSGMLWIAERLGLDAPLGAFNGGTIVRPDGTILSADRIDPALAAKTLAMIETPGVTPWLFADGRWYARTLENAHVPKEIRAASVDPVILDDFTPLLARVDKMVGVSEDHDLLATLEGKVAALLGEHATVSRSQPYYLDVTAPRGNKGDGVVAIADAVGVPLAALAVIGDQRNDLPMFARAAFSIAMGQGPEPVRAAATKVTRSNQDDGVAHAIDDFLIGATAG